MSGYVRDDSGPIIVVNIENVNIWPGNHGAETDEEKLYERISEEHSRIGVLNDKLNRILSACVSRLEEEIAGRNLAKSLGLGAEDDEEDDSGSYDEDDTRVGPSTSDDDIDDIKRSYNKWTCENGVLTDTEARCIKRLANAFGSGMYLRDLLHEIDVCDHENMGHLLEKLPFSSSICDRGCLLALIEPVKDIVDAV